MNPSIDPSLQNPTQPPSSTEATVPDPVQAIPPSSHPSIDNQNALAPTPAAPTAQLSLTVEKQANADAPQPTPENQNGVTDRQLNVTDALSYLDAVKIQFHDRPDVYNVFLDIMKDFKSQVIDTPGVIQRVATLFQGHPFLIQGFNTFLPVGYRIEVGSDSQSSEVITVTTPSGTMLRSTNTPSIPAPPPPSSAPPQQETGQLLPSDQAAVSAPLPPTSALGLSNTPKLSSSSIDLPTPDDHERQVLGPAMEYVQRIKTRFSNDPDTYKQFLEILSNYKSSANNAEVVAKVEELFKDAPDLSSTFLDFLPGTGIQDNDGLNALRGPGTRTGTPTGDHARAQKRKQPAEPAAPPPSAPAKRRRKAADRDKEKERDSGRATGSRVKQPPTGREPPAFSHFNTIPAPPSPRRSGHTYAHHAPPPPTPQNYAQAGTAVALPPQPLASASNFDEMQFFPRVKAALDSRETYHEFLKLVNLFTQDFIDRARLIRESRSFLGEGELMVQLKEILGWDEAIERSALAKEREELYPPPGRPLSILDRPCREELNIRYGSYRRLPADDINVECSGRDEMCKSVLNDEWVSHPSFSSEDSVFMAHKKNLYEEALHRTEEERHEYDFHIDALERTLFRLKPNFGGAGKAVHQRIIKKIYGREAGLELALPVVLARLKQKEIWRAVDVANYARSLDHQGITSKTADKKALTAKAFVAQIEAIMETQMARRAALVDPLYARARPQHQLEYEIEDQDVLRDALKLAFAYLARLGGTQLRLDAARKGWIETRLYSIVRAFFQLNDWDERPSAARPRTTWKHASATVTIGARTTPRATGSNARNGALPANFSGDLRKSLVEERAGQVGPRQYVPITRLALAPELAQGVARSYHSDSVLVESNPTAGEKKRSKRRSFFTNTWFYTLLRMVENIAMERVNDPGFNTRPHTHVRVTVLQYYELMLETCERLFDNQIEQLAFEDQMREMFGLHARCAQSWEQDPKLEKIAKLLWDERRLEAPTAEDHRSFRQQAEGILGPEENLFRIDWLPESKMLTFQLLSKDGSSLDDCRGFVSETETPGVPASKVRRPFLRSQGFYARGGLEIKVCVRTYRLFYVSRTEDVLWRVQAAAERERAAARLSCEGRWAGTVAGEVHY
ncbi:hypothetical protein H4582DRAFT_2109296 [Lactarius indigo]|nr:hypothetical protein H4582DRAFT_2109296 [Lactarius indigo]